LCNAEGCTPAECGFGLPLDEVQDAIGVEERPDAPGELTISDVRVSGSQRGELGRFLVEWTLSEKQYEWAISGDRNSLSEFEVTLKMGGIVLESMNMSAKGGASRLPSPAMRLCRTQALLRIGGPQFSILLR